MYVRSSLFVDRSLLKLGNGGWALGDGNHTKNMPAVHNTLSIPNER